MKRWMIAAMALVVVVAGCGVSETKTVTTPDGTMTVTEKGDQQKVTMQGKDGSTTIEGKDNDFSVTSTDAEGKTSKLTASSNVNLSEIPISLPADAKPKPGEASFAKVEMPDSTVFTVTLVSPQTIEQILNHFKPLLKEPTVTTAPTGGMVLGKTPDGKDVMVAVARDAGETQSTMNVSVTVPTKKP